jgi:hypothetical protein
MATLGTQDTRPRQKQKTINKKQKQKTKNKNKKPTTQYVMGATIIGKYYANMQQFNRNRACTIIPCKLLRTSSSLN